MQEHVRPQGYAPAGDDNCATVPVTAYGMPVVRGGVAYYRNMRFTSEYDPKLCGWLGRLFDLRLNARDTYNEVPCPNERIAAMYNMEPNRFIRGWMSDGLPEAIAKSTQKTLTGGSVSSVASHREELDGRVILFGNPSCGKTGLPHDAPENLVDGFWFDIEISSYPQRRVRVFRLMEVARHFKRTLCFESDCTRGVSSLDPDDRLTLRRVLYSEECRHRASAAGYHMEMNAPYTQWHRGGMMASYGTNLGGATVRREIVGLAGQAALLSSATASKAIEIGDDEDGIDASKEKSASVGAGSAAKAASIPDQLAPPAADGKLRKSSQSADLLLPLETIERASSRATVASIERLVGAEELIEPNYLIGAIPTALARQYTFFRVREAVDDVKNPVLSSLPEVEKQQTRLQQPVDVAGSNTGDRSQAQAATLAAQARAKGIGLLDQAEQCF